MVKIEDLKRINLFKNSPDHLLDIISREAQLSIFNTGTQLITINEKVGALYMLIMGQVAVIRQLTPDIDVILDYVQSGASFGISSIIQGATATYTAICQEPCEVITLSGQKMIELFENNHELAYVVMKDVSRQYKRYMDIRADMILKTIGKERDLKDKVYNIKYLSF
ncbi:MAG: cyclic nucleotide-binding domain-containing protein [Proteobacteria bacterium]|nr:cyclic nucleotide-binding domain-containing protein [Pseudomonadota bacterium]MBU1386606.1 cyclic nucleotide-binding domain-containing protein [Pseudomonadota bacterium]MBU1542507.1 cyclic nucleotide-binding domain-containing protein [Pseudomonadota bacterium]MBU2431271.1 cyclic nucleotide-binding domain-containing protein [Pseudomonadota bacterium]MBU2481537.1 cyclic nucleotide-binding domain-containing protein [Pseudomonadota bacterium]